MIDYERQKPQERLPALGDDHLIEVWQKSSEVDPRGNVIFTEPMYNERLRPDTIPTIIWNEPRWREGLLALKHFGPAIKMNVCLSRHESGEDYPSEFETAIEQADIVFSEAFGWSESTKKTYLDTVFGVVPDWASRSSDYASVHLRTLAKNRKGALMADIDDGSQTAVSEYIKDASDMERMLRIGASHPEDTEMHRKMRLSTYMYPNVLREWVMLAEAGKQLQDLGAVRPGRPIEIAHIVGSNHVGLLYKYRTMGVGRIDYLLARGGKDLAQMRIDSKPLFDMAEKSSINVRDL
jgi:hypothetical protein